MAVFKCKMCGGDLNLDLAQDNVVECEYCSTKQTIPSIDNDKLANLYNRANRLRFSNEFDKAAGVFESIAAEFPEEAEAYWGLCLCKYGIEYVDDPATAKKIPTCHRTSFESIFEDSNFELAQEYADVVAKRLYREEAKEIDRIQKGILEIAGKEEPFDIFICYKETAADGQRTKDSVLAQDMYDALAAKGYKVFFARITLEDKLGQEYEPYIFSALNSAKVMLVVGTDYEYFNAVWVKNEWSRFLDMKKKDSSKVLIPCYADIDAYDMPPEFKNLQAQDMGKVGFIQDLIRGIGKILNPAVEEQRHELPAANSDSSASSNPLLERAYIFLEDGDWDNADKYFEKVLDTNPKNAQAYFGKLLAELRLKKTEELNNITIDFSERDNYQKAYRFADDSLKKQYSDYVKQAVYNRAMGVMNSDSANEYHYREAKKLFESISGFSDADAKASECEEKALECIYKLAIDVMNPKREAEEHYREAKKLFESISGYSDADAKASECEEKALGCIYKRAIGVMNSKNATENQYRQAKKIFESISGYSDADTKALECEEKALGCIYNRAINDMDNIARPQECMELSKTFQSIAGYKDSSNKAAECLQKAEELREEQKKKAELEQREAARRKKKIKLFTVSLIAIVTVFAIVLYTVPPLIRYISAMSLYKNGDYSEAITAFEKMEGFKNSEEMISECKYGAAMSLYDSGNYEEAYKDFLGLDYKDSNDKAKECFSKIKTILPTDNLIAGGGDHSVGVKQDGTVVAVGDSDDGQCDVLEWTDIVAIAAGNFHTIGLKSDGSVVAVGYNGSERCDVSGWTDIVAIAAGNAHTVGLKSDGTVVAVGFNSSGQCDVSEWIDIVAIAAGNAHTVGLKSDGTVVAVGNNSLGQCDVSGWSDIVAIAAGNAHTVGLKSDGTVVAIGLNSSERCNVSDWNGIVAISARYSHIVGLKYDGTVVAVGDNAYGQCDVSSWSDIVAIAAGDDHTLGLRSDGTVVAVGKNEDGQCNVSGWTGIGR